MRRSELDRLRAALDQEAPHPPPGLIAAVLAARPEPRRRNWEWAMGATAILLVFGIVGSLVYFGRLMAYQSAQGPQTRVALSNVNFTCTLPIVVDGTPAFLTFPDGSLTIAKTSEHGYNLAFVYQAGRWLSRRMPIRPSEGAPQESIAVSPDGRSYAYLLENLPQSGAKSEIADVHIREIASGRDRIVYTGLGFDADFVNVGGILGWTAAGIYLATISEIGANPDLYLIDPNSKAAPRRVGPNPLIPPYRASAKAQMSLTNANFTSISGGYAWGYANDWTVILRPDGSAEPGSLSGHRDRILRMDLRNGSVETWYSNPAVKAVWILEFDPQGHPLLSADNNLYLLQGFNQVASVAAPAASDFLGDSHGVWLGSAGSLWLYTPDGQTVRVVTLPEGFFPTPPPPPKLVQLGIPDTTSYPHLVQPAGPCH